jgi:hypothetical protein
MINSFLDHITHQENEFNCTEPYKKIKDLSEQLQKKQYLTSEHPNYQICFDDSSFDAFNEDIFKLIQELLLAFDNAEIIEDLIRKEGIEEKLMENSDSILNCELLRWRTDEPYESYDLENLYSITWKDIVVILIKIATQFAIYSTKDSFSLPFYGTFSPPNISGRILQQNSVFICQIHHVEMRHRNESNPCNILLTQKIAPDFEMEIAHKKEILAELDMLGINLKTVFGDYDNIAKYIRNNFSNEMDDKL